MKIIAVMSPKGGIGKTTTSDSIAYMLGEEQGKRVLVLDGDPQGDTSKTFGVYEPDGIGMSELLEKHECVGGTYKTGDLIRPTEYSHVDIIPANGYLMKTDMNLLLKSEDNQVTRLRTDEVMHFKTSFSFDGITGLPVQQILRDTVAGASESQAFMNNLYESGLTAKATLEYTGELNEKAKTALVKSFEEFGSGAKNTGKILPVPLGMKLTPLDIKLTDSQFFELKKYNALQIAGAFGVKPNQINDYSKSSYSNSEMQQLSFYVDTELFIIKQYEEEINFKMLPDEDADDGYYYKFNEKVLFRTDSKTQMEYLRNGVGGMIIKPNEARRKLDMEDAEGGDVLLANGSIVPLTMAGAAYLKGESEQENADEPEQPEEETEPDTEQPDTATEPDETDEAEDEDEQEGGE